MSRVDVSFLKSKLVGLLAIGVAVAGCSSDGVPNAVNIPSSGENSSSAVVPDESTSLITSDVAFVIGTELAAGDTFQAAVPGAFEPGEDPNSLSVTFLGEPGVQDDLTVPAEGGLSLTVATVPVGICSGPISIDTNLDSVPGDRPITALSPLPAPVVNELGLGPALPDQQIVITGTFFAIDTVTVPVMGGGRETPPNLTVTQNQITFTLPGNAVDGNVEITNSGCDDGVGDTASVFLDVLDAPQIVEVDRFTLFTAFDTELLIFGENFFVDPVGSVNVESITFDRRFGGTDSTIFFADGDYTFRDSDPGEPGDQVIVIPIGNIPDPDTTSTRGRVILNGVTGTDETDRQIIVF